MKKKRSGEETKAFRGLRKYGTRVELYEQYRRTTNLRILGVFQFYHRRTHN